MPIKINAYNQMKKQIKSIMLVDADEINNFINKKVLKSCGVEQIGTYTEPEAAIKHLSETQLKYDVVLIDLFMPMFNAFEFIERFHQLNLEHKHGKICLLTASIDPSVREKCFEAGINYFNKPLNVYDLFTEIYIKETV